MAASDEKERTGWDCVKQSAIVPVKANRNAKKKIVCKLLQGFIRLDYVASEERAKTIADVRSGPTSLN